MEVENSTTFANGLILAMRSVFKRIRNRQPCKMLTNDRILLYAREERDNYRALTSTHCQPIGAVTSATRSDTHNTTRTITTGSSVHQNDIMVDFLEPFFTKPQQRNSFHHLDQETLEASYIECQKVECEYHLIALDNRSRHSSRSPCYRVHPTQIAGSSSADNLTLPGWEAQKTVPICY